MISLGFNHALQNKLEHSIPLPEVCKIFGLLQSKGSIDKESAKVAFTDYLIKHPGASLEFQVKEMYLDNFSSPDNCVSYWLKKFNPAAIQITAWGLEKEVNQSREEITRPAIIITKNFIDLYMSSINDFEGKRKTKRVLSASNIANESYNLLRNSFEQNKRDLRNLKNLPYNSLEIIEGSIKCIENLHNKY